MAEGGAYRHRNIKGVFDIMAGNDQLALALDCESRLGGGRTLYSPQTSFLFKSKEGSPYGTVYADILEDGSLRYTCSGKPDFIWTLPPNNHLEYFLKHLMVSKRLYGRGWELRV